MTAVVSGGFPLGRTTWQVLEDDPYPLLARLRDLEPVTWLAPLNGWALTRHADCESLLRDDRRFVSGSADAKPRRIFGDQMLSRDGDAHVGHRAPFDPAFRLRPVRERCTALVELHLSALLDELAPRGAAEIRAQLAAILPVRVIRDLLGLQIGEREIRTGYDAFATALGDYKQTPGADVAALAARVMLEAELRREVSRARDGRGDGVVAAIIGNSTLDDTEVVANCLVVMFGGIETVESLIVNALFAVLHHAPAHAAMVADSSLIPGAIDETLRWAPPVGHPGRMCIADTSIGGVPIAAGERVHAIVFAANRDPRVFDEPDRFDIRRPNARRSLAFGHGPHFCLGFNLARLQAALAVAGSLQRLPNLRLDDAMPPPHMTGFSFRSVPALHLEWDPA